MAGSGQRILLTHSHRLQRRGTLVPGSATTAMVLPMVLHDLPGRNFGRVITYLRNLVIVYYAVLDKPAISIPS